MDSLPSDYSYQDQHGNGPSKSAKLRYRAICQAGIVVAAALGIDLTGIINENPDFQLRKLSRGRSRDSSSSSLNFNYRPRKGSSGDKRKVNVGDSNSIVYGTYRKNTDPDSRQIIVSSHPNLIDLDDISSPLRSYDVIYGDDFDPFSSPSQDSRPGSNERSFRYSNPELDSINRNVSRTSLQSSQYGSEDRPERPNTLDLLQNEQNITQNEHNNQKFRKFGISPKISNIANSSAFPNSSASSSSQSPASTPSPKTNYPPSKMHFSPTRKLTLLDTDVERDDKRLPMPLLEAKRNMSRETSEELTFL